MKIIFTICSNNYLAQAKTLGDSIKRNNPEYRFVIGLVDKFAPEIDYDKEIGYELIPCEDIGIPDFDSLFQKYNIIELNTSVKPFYFKYFTENTPDLEFLMYFDPDLFVFSDLKELEADFGNDNILLTPHILSPIPIDGKSPQENVFLNHGIYNLGFIGLRKPATSEQFISWWCDRTYHLCYDELQNGLFVDQLWINLVPLFFKKVKISGHLGLNMAPWNLHERNVTSKPGNPIRLNDKQNLIFYHFSNYKFNNPDVLANYYDRFTFENRPDLRSIYTHYCQLVVENNYQTLSKIKCYYVLQKMTSIVEKKVDWYSDLPSSKKTQLKVVNKLRTVLTKWDKYLAELNNKVK